MVTELELKKLAGGVIYELTARWESWRGANESLIDGLTRSFSQPRIDLLISTHLSFFDHAVSPLEHLRQLYETGVVSDKLVFNMDI